MSSQWKFLAVGIDGARRDANPLPADHQIEPAAALDVVGDEDERHREGVEAILELPRVDHLRAAERRQAARHRPPDIGVPQARERNELVEDLGLLFAAERVAHPHRVAGPREARLVLFKPEEGAPTDAYDVVHGVGVHEPAVENRDGGLRQRAEVIDDERRTERVRRVVGAPCMLGVTPHDLVDRDDIHGSALLVSDASESCRPVVVPPRHRRYCGPVGL